MQSLLRRASLALAVLVALAGCGPVWSDPPAQPKPPPAPANRDGIDDLIAAGGQKSGVPKRPADDKDDPADLLKGLDAPEPPPRKPDPGSTRPDIPEPPAPNPGQTKPDTPEPPAPKPPPRKTGLPKYYDQLDLTQDQIEKIHKVSEKYDGRIADLKRKLDRVRQNPFLATDNFTILVMVKRFKNLVAQRHDALMKVLTEPQRQKLKTLLATERK